MNLVVQNLINDLKHYIRRKTQLMDMLLNVLNLSGVKKINQKE